MESLQNFQKKYDIIYIMRYIYVFGDSHASSFRNGEIFDINGINYQIKNLRRVSSSIEDL